MVFTMFICFALSLVAVRISKKKYQAELKAKLTECKDLFFRLHEDSISFWRTFVDQEQVDKVLGRLADTSREDFLRFSAAAEERGFRVLSLPQDVPS